MPAALLDVLRRLDEAGHRSWLVGGAVRDALLHRRRVGADHDVATPARPEQVAALFPRVIATGAEHGTVTVVARGAAVEVTTFRGEGAYLDARRPSSVTFLDDVAEDLARRDLTVNAIAYDPLGRVLRDPFGGRADLRRRVLRAVGDPAARFAEDGLRPLRAVRFAAELGFALDPATAAAIPGALAAAGRVSAERVAQELSRLLTAPHAVRGLELLDQTGLLEVVLPALAGASHGARAHAFATAGKVGRDLTLRLAALLHVVAGPGAPEGAGARVRALLSRMRFAARVAEGAAALVEAHGCLLAEERPPPPATDAEVRRWLARVGRERAPALLALWSADARVLEPPARSRRERAALRAHRARLARVERARPPLAAAELALGGREIMALLGVPAGPAVGEALRHLLERVLEDPGLNTPEALASELRDWWAGRGH